MDLFIILFAGLNFNLVVTKYRNTVRNEPIFNTVIIIVIVIIYTRNVTYKCVISLH